MIKSIFKVFLKKKPRLFPVLIILIVMIGIISYQNLPLEYMPGRSADYYTINVAASSLDPMEVERAICIPLEKRLRKIDGVTNIYSSCKKGQLKINVKTLEDNDTRIYAAITAVCSELYEDFPENVSKPVVMRFSSEDMPITVIQIKKDLFKEDIEERYVKTISRFDGISKVDVLGGKEEKKEIIIDKDKLSILKIGLAQISDLLRKYSIRMGVKSYGKNIIITTPIKRLEEIMDIPVKNLQGKAYYFKDFSKIETEQLKRRSFSRIDGKPANVLYVYKESTSNTVSICNMIRDYTEKDEDLEILFDQGQNIKDSIKSLFKALMVGALISGIFIISIFRNVTLLFPILLVIPLSFLSVFAFMYFSSISLNVMSMSAFLFSLGLLYDNSVIIIESIEREINIRKKKSFKVIYSALIKILPPVFISTLTTFCVFLPIFFAKKELYEMYKDFAWVLGFSLFSSFFLASIAVPYFIYFFYIRRDSEKNYKDYEFFNSFFTARLLSKKKYISTIALVIFMISIFFYNSIGTSKTDQTPDNMFIFLFQPGLKMSSEDFSKDMKKIEDYLNSIDGVKRTLTTFQGETARLVLEVKKERLREIADKYSKIKEDLSKYPDISFFLMNAPVDTFNEIDINVFGNDFKERIKKAGIISSDIKDKMGDLFDQIIIKERPPVDEIEVVLDRSKIADLGFSIQEVAYIIRAYIEGPKIQGITQDSKRQNKVRASNINNIEDIRSLPIRKLKSVMLGDIADINIKANPSSVVHEDSNALVKIGLTFKDIDEYTMMKMIRRTIDEKNLKRKNRILYSFDKKTMKLKETRREMTLIIIFTMLFLSIVLYMYYNTFIDVLIVFSVIPLTYSLLIIIMSIFKMSWSLPVYIAFILLSGIVVNNSILVVDFIKKDQSHSLIFKIIHSINNKFRAVLITTATTIFGLVPLIFADSFWRTMGIIAIAGLGIGTLISLYVMPILYYSIKKK